MDFLISNTVYTQAPWPQHPKLGMRVAKALSSDCMDSLPAPPPPFPEL